MSIVDWFTKKFGDDSESQTDFASLSDSELIAQASVYYAMLDEAKEPVLKIRTVMDERGLQPVRTWDEWALSTTTGTTTTSSDEAESEESQDAKPDQSETSEAEPPSVPYALGPEDAPVAFIGASLSPTDKARRSHLTGPGGETLRDLYLEALDMKRSEVVMGTIVPELLLDERGKPREPTEEEIGAHLDAFWKSVDDLKPKALVALGKTARDALGDAAAVWLPHPIAVRINGDRGEVARKLKSLRKSLDEAMAKADQQSEFDVEINATIVKSDNERQLITGVVLEPDVPDTQGDVIQSTDVERAAHFYLTQSRVIGDEHSGLAADVQVVESYIAPVDMQIGEQIIRKGTWLMTVHVADSDRWERVKAGEYTGFSIGGTAMRIMTGGSE